MIFSKIEKDSIENTVSVAIRKNILELKTKFSKNSLKIGFQVKFEKFCLRNMQTRI